MGDGDGFDVDTVKASRGKQRKHERQTQTSLSGINM